MPTKNTTAVTKKEDTAIDFKVEAEQYLFSQNANISDGQKMLFLKLAEVNKLNPFTREIHAVPFWNSKTKNMDLEPVTGYQVYIARAEASGKLDGWNCKAVYNNGNLFGASIEIWRKDFEKPFTWSVALSEFIGKKKDGTISGNWAKMPEFMIKKVAIGQGFRLAFPNELGSMPYLTEEIDKGYNTPSNGPREGNKTNTEKIVETFVDDDVAAVDKISEVTQELETNYKLEKAHVDWIEKIRAEGTTVKILEAGAEKIRANCMKADYDPNTEIATDVPNFEVEPELPRGVL
jgi:phage recombination protein Bet